MSQLISYETPERPSPCFYVTDAKESLLVEGIVGEFVSIPCVEVQLTSNLVNGSVKAGLVDSFPIDGVDMLMGNDLAGGQVTITPHLTSMPLSAKSTETVDDNLNDMFPSCITTRAQKSKACYSNEFFI